MIGEFSAITWGVLLSSILLSEKPIVNEYCQHVSIGTLSKESFAVLPEQKREDKPWTHSKEL